MFAIFISYFGPLFQKYEEEKFCCLGLLLYEVLHVTWRVLFAVEWNPSQESN
jgi:hypothetical protein